MIIWRTQCKNVKKKEFINIYFKETFWIQYKLSLINSICGIISTWKWFRLALCGYGEVLTMEVNRGQIFTYLKAEMWSL